MIHFLLSAALLPNLARRNLWSFGAVFTARMFPLASLIAAAEMFNTKHPEEKFV